MKLSDLKFSCFLFIACVVWINARSQSKPINIVTTAVPFTRIAPDARAGGMGDIGMATSPDANSGYYNMGKAAFNSSKIGVGISYIPWLRDLDVNDVYLLAASGYVKISDEEAISGGVRYFSLGNLQFTDNLGNQIRSFKPWEMGIEAGYSRRLSNKIGVGVSLRYIHSNLAGNDESYKTGNSVAGDLGFFYSQKNSGGNGWNFGAAMTNLGAKIGYSKNDNQKDFIPANLGLGTAYTKVFDENNRISVGLDINKLLVPTPPIAGDSAGTAKYRNKSVVGSWFSSFGDAPDGFSEEIKEFQLGIGTEYSYNNQFFARAGYFTESKLKGNRRYFTVGAGLKYNIAGIDFSYLIPTGSDTNNNPLSNTMRFSLLFDFDNSRYSR